MSPPNRALLHYVADPMCSWCWGFAPVLERLTAALPDDVELRWVMGGLAPDSDAPMPDGTRAMVQGAWRAVAAATGARFDWSFWERCSPRRSTWPACRAVLAAGLQGAGPGMFRAIQRAYYTEARNPSDRDVLVALASELDPPLDAARFAADLGSPDVEELLQGDLGTARRLGARGFPSLVLEDGRGIRAVSRGYAPFETVAGALAAAGLSLAPPPRDGRKTPIPPS